MQGTRDLVHLADRLPDCCCCFETCGVRCGISSSPHPIPPPSPHLRACLCRHWHGEGKREREETEREWGKVGVRMGGRSHRPREPESQTGRATALGR
ncbi:hypothetical protein E2C01_041489 [Portunus trituberculatus]|uniref:Uncharacterized protein n=1 Tax=Portunus trituberculatus TaxID=210409 RepID=A0A5B7FRU2_PORTR|nr:hypothetical protein [Portunus trituberculatus]